MSIFGAKPGWWCIESVSDPRWNKSGNSENIMFPLVCKEAQKWVDECKEKYGEPPADVECSQMKD